MALLSDDIIRITNEVINDQEPKIADDKEQASFRRKIRKEVKAIVAAGLTPESPFEMPDPNLDAT